MCREAKFVPGAGATEIELASQIREFALTCKGLDQYAVKAYGEALEVVPRTLAANTGMDFEDTVAKLYASHSNPKEGAAFGVDVLGKSVFDAVEKGILDLMVTKKFAIRLAVQSVLTILRVDHIIMSKPAGGPKKPKRKGHWDDDDDAW
jgi:T-complex protein 1 subunit theta